MTMAVSLQFDGGVILCADRLMTHGNAAVQPAFASYRRKIWAYDERGFSMIVTGAGDAHVIKSIGDELHDQLVSAQGPEEELYQFPSSIDGKVWTVKGAFESVLETILTRIPTTEGANVLIAVNQYISGVSVFRNDGFIVNTAKPIEPVGIGETSLVSFLTDGLYSESLSYSEAVSLGTLIMFAAKTYCPQYCGGPTDICSFRPKERKAFEEPRETIDALEESFRETGSELKPLLTRAAKLVQQRLS
jgi:hypothetical protein